MLRLPTRDGSAFHVVVESPRGARVKLKYDPELGAHLLEDLLLAPLNELAHPGLGRHTDGRKELVRSHADERTNLLERNGETGLGERLDVRVSVSIVAVEKGPVDIENDTANRAHAGRCARA
jgi:hypothetical protein